MRKIVAGLFMSLDGVVESPERWQFPYFNDEMGQALGSSMAASDTLLLGRRTYQEFAATWPGRGSDDPVGAYMNNTPKLVASTTLNSTDWHNSTVLDGDLAEEVGRLKAEYEGDIVVHGSVQLVQALLDRDLVDELRLMVYPVVLGAGKRLFGETSDKKPLRLVESKTVGDGVTILIFQPAGET